MDLEDQVRAAVAEHELFIPGDTVVVAVSGGPDSLALLHVLRAQSAEYRIRLHVAHLNHQLRGQESDADAEFVARLARDWGLPATVQICDVAALAREWRLSLEEAARRARYAFLAETAAGVNARVIAVAHNADDQVETLLMHLLRGAGLAGLRGMSFKSSAGTMVPSSTPNLEIVRPLLHVTRTEIQAYCEVNGLVPRVDRSNLDTTFFRNRLRLETIPYLEQLNPNLRQVLLHTAEVLGGDYRFLQTQVRQAYAAVARAEQAAVVFDRHAWCALDPALQRGTLRAAVQHLRRDLRDVDWTHVEDARRVALSKGTGARATLPHGLMLAVGYDDFVIAGEEYAPGLPDWPLLDVPRLELPIGAVVDLPTGKAVDLPTGRVVNLPNSPWCVTVETMKADQTPQPAPQLDRWTAVFDADRLEGGLALRSRAAGDRFGPAGMQGREKSLHEFMVDQKIPRALRERLPLLIAGDRIVWVCGWRISEFARVTGATRRFLRVSFKKRVEGRHAA